MSSKRTATAFAPASIGNVCVGFDILGHAIDGPGDTVTVRKIDEPVVEMRSVSGLATSIPQSADQNTAAIALMHMRDDLGLQSGFAIDIEKGIPLASGMGGSAASAVGAVVAANALLDKPLPVAALLPYALAGEAVASGALHADNVAPSLIGGLVLARGSGASDIVPISVPDGISCALVHPHCEVETKAAREALKKAYPLAIYVTQSANLAGFLAACFSGDIELLRRSFDDVLIEPHRRHLIPGFSKVKAAARNAGSIGCSISGGGPSMFAWCESKEQAEAVTTAMREAFWSVNLDSDAWITPVNCGGARVTSSG